MSRSDLSSLEQRPVDWDMEDQARCWEDQRRDEEELQQMRREVMREQIKREVVQEFLAEIKPQIDEVMVKWGRRSYATGFLMGFGAALCGAVLFIYFS